VLRAGDKIGPYTLVSKIGRGSFGVVWLAERRGAITTTKVAIKFPLDEDVDLDAVKREADLWVEACGHPNVLTLYEADIYDDQPVIVSEYAPDGSLTKWLARHGGKAPSHDVAVQMTFGILSGLDHLHKKRIIHRDLKPDNVLLQGENPRLADFGIARVLKTSQSSIMGGTYAYMAPEAFRNERSEQVDVWAAGVIFYQMLAGRLPFPQTDAASLMHAILITEPDPLPHTVPEGLRAVIAGALMKNTGQRYKTATEMRAKLKEATNPPAPREPKPDAAVRGGAPPLTTEPAARTVGREATVINEPPPAGFTVDVSGGDFAREVLGSAYPVLVVFWAQWSAPDRMYMPTVQAVAEKYTGRVKVVRINVDEIPDVAQRYGIKGIPTTIVINRGKEEERIVGATNKEVVSRMLDKVLS
jgi:serine/threonine-protein kinase